MEISGKTMIFRNDYGYSTTISNKNQEGQYDKMYLTVQFLKGVELENKTLINIKDGFLSFYKTKVGLSKVKIVVKDYEIAEDYKIPFLEDTTEQLDDLMPF